MGSGVAYRIGKRLFDVAFSATAIAACAPVMAGVALWVRLQDRHSSIYRGVRAGRHGKPFEILKFRTMVIDAERIGSITTANDDPRILHGASFLRKWKLDELPQFVNVLKGDMSVVGPRPEIPQVVAGYGPDLQEILEVPPGIVDFGTLWNYRQGERLRGVADPYAEYMRSVFPMKTRMSLEYVRRRSLHVDAKIVVAAFAASFLGVDPSWCFPEGTPKAGDLESR